MAAKEALLEAVRPTYGLAPALRALGLPASTWHHRHTRPRPHAEKHAPLRPPLEAIAGARPAKGYRRTTAELRARLGLAVNHKVVQRFRALDAQTRESVQLESATIWSGRHTIVFVTHEPDEAGYPADRVVVLSTRPGRAPGIIDVPLPRPRPLDIKRSAEVSDRGRRLWLLVRDEVTAAHRVQANSVPKGDSGTRPSRAFT